MEFRDAWGGQRLAALGVWGRKCKLDYIVYIIHIAFLMKTGIHIHKYMYLSGAASHYCFAALDLRSGLVSGDLAENLHRTILAGPSES